MQDSAFLERLGRLLEGRTAVLRRVGAGLEVRIEINRAKALAPAKRAAAALVRRAAGPRDTITVVSAEGLEGPPLDPGIYALPTAVGASGSHLATPTPGSDRAPCAECLREFSHEGRRHAYVHTECLRCGPRYSHASSFPLTRSSYGLTTLPPCAACVREAKDPGSRRFASERVSCGECGPTLTLVPSQGAPVLRGALRRAAERLRAGDVVAAQTPYGFVALASPKNVASMRVELGDEFAGLSLLVPSLPAARHLAPLSAKESRSLASPAAPEVSVEPAARSVELARALSVFGHDLRLRLPDSPVLHALVAEAGPVVLAGASRGGAFLPQHAREPGGLPHAWWLTDDVTAGDPIPPTREFFLGGRRILLAHGRGSLPASAQVGHDRTLLAMGGGDLLFGAVAFAGRAHLTGNAGPSSRAQSAYRLRRLISRAAALSFAARAEEIDAVVVGPEEGTPARLVAEESAETAGAPVVEVSPLVARAMAAAPLGGRPPPVAVLGGDEAVAATDAWIGSQRTGGEVVDVRQRKLVGGIAPFELVESPGGRADLVGPMASVFDRAGAAVLGTLPDDAPLLDALRSRASSGSSFVLLVDAVAAALGLVPRRAPPGSGVAEVAAVLGNPHFARRFRLTPHLTSSRGCRQVDSVALLRDWAEHWHAAHRREGEELAWERRMALGASLTHALLDGVAKSARRSLGRPSRVLLTGTAFASPAFARVALERFRAAGLTPSFPAETPILDGALPLGQARAFAKSPNRPRKSR